MTVYYLDSSAILKRYKTEAGSQLVDELFDGRRPQELFSSSLYSAVEVVSSASRLRKGGALSQREYEDVVSRFFRDFGALYQIGAVDTDLMGNAIRAAVTHGLRTGDAVQMAAAQRAKQATPGAEQFVVVASDGDLVRACRAVGLVVLDPQEIEAPSQLRRMRK